VLRSRSTSSVSAGTSMKTGSPLVLRRSTRTRQRRFMLLLAAKSKHLTSVTLPLSASASDDQLVEATVAL
jgi:hypothetical protein